MSPGRLTVHRGLRRRAAVALGIAVGSVALLAPTAPAATNVTIKGDSIANYKFSPRTVEIKKRKRVNWSWDSNAPHNVTFKKLGKASKTGSSGSYSLRFKKKGKFRYVCTLHGFTGKVIVG